MGRCKPGCPPVYLSPSGDRRPVPRKPRTAALEFHLGLRVFCGCDRLRLAPTQRPMSALPRVCALAITRTPDDGFVSTAASCSATSTGKFVPGTGGQSSVRKLCVICVCGRWQSAGGRICLPLFGYSLQNLASKYSVKRSSGRHHRLGQISNTNAVLTCNLIRESWCTDLRKVAVRNAPLWTQF